MVKRDKVDEAKYFVSRLINEEQNAHAKLLADLKAAIGKTREFEDAAKVLSQIYEAKIELLEKIYKELQGV